MSGLSSLRWHFSWERMRRGSFSHQVATLGLGSVAAQGVAYLTTPILSRLYSAEALGIAAVFVGVAATVAQSANAKFDLAIGMASDEGEAESVFRLSIVTAIFIAVILSAVVLVFGRQIASALGIPPLQPWLLMLPVIVLLTGVRQSTQLWLNRLGRFGAMSSAAAAQALGTTAFRLGFGFLHWAAPGLVAGTAAGLVCHNAVVATRTPAGLWKPGPDEWRTLWRLACKYRQLATSYTIASTLNSVAATAPVVAINKVFSSSDAGFFNLVALVIGVPSSIVAGAVGQVYLNRITAKAADQNHVGLMYRVALQLALIWLPGAILLIAAGPMVFSWAFGWQWEKAGEMARYAVIAYGLQFIASPFSMAFHVCGGIAVGSAWKICFAATTVLLACFASRLTVLQYVQLWTLHDSVYYTAQWFIARRLVCAYGKRDDD